MSILQMVAVAALLAFVPGRHADVPEQVMVLERNSVVHWEADHTERRYERRVSLTQWIIWASYEDGQEHVRCWKIVKDPDLIVPHHGQWRLHVSGGRDVIARIYRRTETPVDREIEDRELVPQAFRHRAFAGWSQ